MIKELIQKIINLKIRKRLLFAGAILLTVSGFLLFSSYGIIKSIKLATQRIESIDELKNLAHTNDSLRQKIKELQNDTNEIERIAREKYGMMKPGEKIYIRKKKEKE
jgi:cell division protein FtsB